MNTDLADLCLTPFFTGQLTVAELEDCVLGRVTEIQRSGIIVNDGSTEHSITLERFWFQQDSQTRPTVGDWVVLNAKFERILRVLDRKSLFKRVAAGEKVEVQLIAANIDTLFVVTSCNNEFNESRLERYLSLAIEAGVDPVVVLTKTDLIESSKRFVERVRSVSDTVPIETVNSLDLSTLSGLKKWISTHSTIALAGSSGVGKSSILNSLVGRLTMDTAPVREQDSRGRHTTTYRALHKLADGGMLLDVPGMRELKVAEIDAALDDLFEDIQKLADECKFRDCDHDQERDCAVLRALNNGDIDERRLQNYRKLRAEDARRTEALAEQRKRTRQIGKTAKSTVQPKKQPKKKS